MTVNLTIDGRPITVAKGTAVWAATKMLGIDVPVFCFHDRMPAFGACRVCLVEVDKMPKLQTSCTLEATEGMVVRTQASAAVEGRKSILEFLLINHPLDCPICDRAGECPLQNQTLNHGPGESRFFEAKRRFTKAVPIGPVLMLDRERCISCARCTRFGDIVAGDHALEFVDRGYKTEVGTPDSGPAKSKFIGNTIMICPVGALTSQVYRFRARPWDNEITPSTCALCPVGCSLTFDSRDGQIMRTRSFENKAVNDIWLCDKGWFGYEFASHPDRLTQPLIRRDGVLEPAGWDEALSLVSAKMREFRSGGLVAGLGGSTLTVEENYLFQNLIRQGAGVNHVDYRVGKALIELDKEGLPPGMETTIGECEKLSSALLLGVDLSEEFPVIWLRLKHAINYGASVFFSGHFKSEISPHMQKTVVHAPGDELATLKELLPQWLAQISAGKSAAIFIGQQYLSSQNRGAIVAEIQCARQHGVSINILEGSGNSMGARFAGMHPELGPFDSRVAKKGLNTSEIIEAAATTGWDLLYVVGANPATHVSSAKWLKARAQLKFLVVQDLFLSDSASQADVVLPTLCHIEKSGSFINIEGRIQKLNPGKEIPAGLYSDEKIFSLLAAQLNIDTQMDAINMRLAEKRISFSRRTSKNSRIDTSSNHNDGKLHGSLAPVLFDNGQRMLRNPQVVQLARVPTLRLHPDEATKRQIVDGSVVEVKAHGRSLRGPVSLDKGVAFGTVVLPLGFADIPVAELNGQWLNGFEIEIQPLL